MADEIRAWLNGLGLGQYVETFEINDLDLDLVAELSDRDLEKLGVASLGHRKRLMRAIGALGSMASGNTNVARSLPYGQAGLSAATPPDYQAERRQLTVMFCDLVGSTLLSARLDPEQMREVIQAYQNAVAGEIARFEGHVAKFMGDGVLAYFGWPHAHEDDAERAVRASLAAADTVGRLTTPAGDCLAARIGIATGLVVVGELIGNEEARERAVVGETPNLAARLQALAEPGGIIIGERTRRLVGELFELADLGRRRLKGFDEPVAAWQVVGIGAAESRFEAMHAAELAPLVGRRHELDLLVERWELAKGGEGQVVLLAGEPGIGKSRLIKALQERIANEPHVRLLYYCSPYHTNSALHPVVEQLKRAAGFLHGDGVDDKLDKLAALLRQSGDPLAELVPLLAALCAVPTSGRYPPLRLTPQAQKAKTFEALLAQLKGLSDGQPVLMLVEDGHWIDPSTSELFGQVIDRVKHQPVLLVLTLRPDFTPPWSGQAHLTSLILCKLGQRHGAALVECLTGGKALPPEIMRQILANTDGVPLFVEELTRAILESGLLIDSGDRYDLPGQLPPLAIPSTLQDSLMARLDRLGSAKEVAQIGAAIGREFSYGLLAAIAQLGHDDLRAALAQLRDAELVFQRGTPPDATYIFKHALVQDVAHGSLLHSRRRPLHARIAQVLEELFPETVDAQPELLARHCTEAELPDKAIHYWRAAGERAAKRADALEAIQYFRMALGLLESRPESPERLGGELKVLTQLGPALMLAKGWAAPEVGQVYERARTLARRLQSSAQLVPPLVGSWLFYYSRGQLDAADETTGELFRVAQTFDDPDLLLQAHHAAWPVPMLRGEFATADAHVRKGLALYDYHRHKHHALLYMGHDPAVCGQALGSQIAWILGFSEQADQRAEGALQLARRLGHAPTLAFALWFVGNAQAACGDHAATLGTAEALFSLSEEQALVQTRAAALALRGWALAQGGQPKEGIGQLQQALTVWNRIGARPYLQVFRCLLGESLMQAELHREAAEQFDLALANGAQTGERWWDARICELRGQLLLRKGPRHRARALEAFETALRIARAQGAKAWELRAATSLARCRAEQGERRMARDLLAPVYGTFTEGFGSANLKQAKALLDALA